MQKTSHPSFFSFLEGETSCAEINIVELKIIARCSFLKVAFNVSNFLLIIYMYMDFKLWGNC